MKTYWKHDWAIQQDDKLAGIQNPKGILGPVELPLVEETAAPTITPPGRATSSRKGATIQPLQKLRRVLLR